MKHAIILLLLSISIISYGQIYIPDSVKVEFRGTLDTGTYQIKVRDPFDVSSLPKSDTIRVVMLLSDTTFRPNISTAALWSISDTIGYSINRVSFVWWQYGYEIRSISYEIRDIALDPNYRLPSGGYTLMGHSPIYKPIPIYTHVTYLDDRKRPLANKIVWMSKPLN